ncbi:hypothetical protein EHQ13_11460 [Leptospira gomenensis]|uniref:Uncharacterized protein n=1 Tax=Leptospira gomenensis TaxID=2484974 RepID=A0A5F1YAJ8_9LEPT|nr:hypothetical protein [Leptospira gomenensis]TGK33882.1 hypothetical protein EHQ17_10300 [Leptospira gomenensis]TGK52107.1 hypothetical protein EHQ07_00595 [Leptospira gomenensis]TGK59844.1 hypothetical protein EHQ13_11460 [Leptospira gomenensis]
MSGDSSITKEFIELFRRAFPTIDEIQITNLGDMLKQFHRRSNSTILTEHGSLKSDKIDIQVTTSPNDILMQGDILDKVAIPSIDRNGEISIVNGPSVIISASCDCENDPSILIASCYPYERVRQIVKSEDELKKNIYYRFFSFGNSSDINHSLVADFSAISSVSKFLIEDRIKSGKIMKVASLSQIGYYWFITKLYIHLLRVEGLDAIKFRKF